MSEQNLLVLVTTPSIEALLVDWLLAREDIGGFSTTAVHGHGTADHRLSLAEQVEGRQQQVMFHVQLAAARLRPVLDDLQREFAGSPIHYWAVSLLAAGHCEADGDPV